MCCESTELLEVYHLLPLDLQCPRTLLFKCTVLFPGYESVEVDFFVVVIVVVFFVFYCMSIREKCCNDEWEHSMV